MCNTASNASVADPGILLLSVQLSRGKRNCPTLPRNERNPPPLVSPSSSSAGFRFSAVFLNISLTWDGLAAGEVSGPALVRMLKYCVLPRAAAHAGRKPTLFTHFSRARATRNFPLAWRISFVRCWRAAATFPPPFIWHREKVWDFCNDANFFSHRHSMKRI